LVDIEKGEGYLRGNPCNSYCNSPSSSVK